MNRECTSITFQDILKYPNHYITELIQYPGNSFLLFQYGPYLIMNNDTSYWATHLEECNLTYGKNELFRFMLDIGTLLKIKNGYITNMKKDILAVIYDLPLDDYGCAKITRKIANDMLKELRRYQYEHKVLESAIIDYCPIVPYSSTIIEPEMSCSIDNKITKEITDDDIIEFLKNHIIEIMQQPKLFLSIDTDYKKYNLKDDECKSKLSADILKLCEEENNPVRTYFLMVYLRYCVSPEDYVSTTESLFNLNNTYNKLLKGEMVNISEAVAQFSDIELPYISETF